MLCGCGCVHVCMHGSIVIRVEPSESYVFVRVWGGGEESLDSVRAVYSIWHA